METNILSTKNKDRTTMIQEFTKTIDGILSIIVAAFFYAFTMAQVNATCTLISSLCAIFASIFAIAYYYKQMKVNGHIKRGKKQYDDN